MGEWESGRVREWQSNLYENNLYMCVCVSVFFRVPFSAWFKGKPKAKPPFSTSTSCLDTYPHAN